MTAKQEAWKERAMPKFRKKPVVIEAWQYGPGFADQAPGEFQEAIEYTVTETVIQTLEGPMKVSYADYIIKGLKGEFYPCKPDIFQMTYEPALESE